MISQLKSSYNKLKITLDLYGREPVSQSLDWYLREHESLHLLAKSQSPFKNNILINRLIAHFAPHHSIGMMVTMYAKALNYQDQIERRGGKTALVKLSEADHNVDALIELINSGTTVLLTYEVADGAISEFDHCKRSLMAIFRGMCEPLSNSNPDLNNREKDISRARPEKKKRIVIVDGGISAVHESLPVLCAQLRALGFKIVVTAQSSEPHQLVGLTPQLLANFFTMTDDVTEIGGAAIYAGLSRFSDGGEVFLDQDEIELDKIDMSGRYFYRQGNVKSAYLVDVA